jgi:hypothetical protein
MPPEPIEYQIVLNLQTALLAIAVAGGAHYNVAGGAVKLDPNQNVEALITPGGPRPFVLIEIKPERREYFPSSQLHLFRPIAIHWVSDSDATVDSSRLQVALRGVADVERAIALDITRGGLAYETRIVDTNLDAFPDHAEVWTVTETEIVLHRTYGEPDV